MAIDTKTQETLRTNQSIKNMRRGDSPESSCQLPTTPAHSSLISLTQGLFAIVDADNYEWLNQWKWYAHKRGNTFYARRSKYIGGGAKNRKYKTILMHRIILKAKDGQDTDHINHNGLDNRLFNMRLCNCSQNQQNRIKNFISSSIYKGVSWSKYHKGWIAQIMHKRKGIRIGCFDDEIEAAIAYDTKAKELFGDFALVNF